jgi:hypothetical protein
MGQSTPWQRLRHSLLQPNLLAIAISVGLHGAVAASLPFIGLNQDSQGDRILDSNVVELTPQELAQFAPSATQEFGAGASGFDFEQNFSSTVPPSLSNRSSFPPPPPADDSPASRDSIQDRWTSWEDQFTPSATPPPMSQSYESYTYRNPGTSSQDYSSSEYEDIWQQYQQQWEDIQRDRSYPSRPSDPTSPDPSTESSQQDLLEEKKDLPSTDSPPPESEGETEQAGVIPSGDGYRPGMAIMRDYYAWLGQVYEANPSLEDNTRVWSQRDPQVIEGTLPPQPAYERFLGQSFDVGVLVAPDGRVDQLSPLPASPDLLLQPLLENIFNNTPFPEQDQYRAYWFQVNFTPEAQAIDPESSEPEPSEPESSEPEPSEPESSKPEPSEPEPSEPISLGPEQALAYISPLNLSETAQERWLTWLDTWLNDSDLSLSLPQEPLIVLKRELPSSRLAQPQRIVFAITQDQAGNLLGASPYPLQVTGDEALDQYARQILIEALAERNLESSASDQVLADVMVVDLIPTEGPTDTVQKSPPGVDQAPEPSSTPPQSKKR